MMKPKGWRTGQTISNFLAFLKSKKKIGDPFYISDEDWVKYYKEFYKDINDRTDKTI